MIDKLFLFTILILLFGASCSDSSYTPSYIISDLSDDKEELMQHSHD